MADSLFRPVLPIRKNVYMLGTNILRIMFPSVKIFLNSIGFRLVSYVPRTVSTKYRQSANETFACYSVLKELLLLIRPNLSSFSTIIVPF